MTFCGFARGPAGDHYKKVITEPSKKLLNAIQDAVEQKLMPPCFLFMFGLPLPLDEAAVACLSLHAEGLEGRVCDIHGPELDAMIKQQGYLLLTFVFKRKLEPEDGAAFIEHVQLHLEDELDRLGSMH